MTVLGVQVFVVKSGLIRRLEKQSPRQDMLKSGVSKTSKDKEFRGNEALERKNICICRTQESR